MNGNSVQHLSIVLQWIKDEKHFGIVRPADGEFYVLSNKTLTNIDNWTYTSGGILQNDLLSSLKMKNPNIIIYNFCLYGSGPASSRMQQTVQLCSGF